MPPNGTLVTADYNALKSRPHDVPYFLSFRKDVEIATATVAVTPQGFTYNQIQVSDTSAHWLNAREGMAAKITDSLGTTLRGYYRVRSTASSYIVIEEIAPADPGILATTKRTTAIMSTDIIHIIERFDLYSVKPHTKAGVIYQDGDIVIGNRNLHPEVIVNIAINSQPGDFFTMQATDGGTTHISATATIVKWPTSSGSTISYAWITPSAWSNVSGASTATLSADAPPGDYILYLQVTDSIASVTQEVCRWVRIHSPSDPPVLVNITADPRDMSSRKMTVRAVQGRIGAIPPGAKCAVWGPALWGNSLIASATAKFVGYLYQQPFTHEPAWYETNADIWSTAAILDTLMCSPATLTYAGTPVTWEQLPASLQTVQFAEWWLARWRVANLLKCYNFTPISTSSSTGRKLNISIAQGSILQQLQALADMYDANCGSRSDGEIISVRLPWMMANQGSLVFRGTFDNTMYNNVKVTWLRRATTGFVEHDGYWSDLTADFAVGSQWPGLQTFGQGKLTEKKTSKIYESQEDNQERTGCAGAFANREYVQVEMEFFDNWDVFEPADCMPITVIVPPDKSPTSQQIAVDCVPQTVTKTYISGRRAKLKVVCVGLTNGYAGQPIPPAPAVATPPTPSIPSLPVSVSMPLISDVGAPPSGPVPTPTPAGQIAKFTGEGLFVGSSTDAWCERNFISLTTPQSNKITPVDLGDYRIQDVLIEPSPTFTHIGAYILAYNSGTDKSAVWYCPDWPAPAPSWTKGGDIDNQYTAIRGSNVAGEICIYKSGTPSTTIAVTFDAGGYAYTILSGAVAGGGHPGNCLDGISGDPTDAHIEIDLGGVFTVNDVNTDWKKTHVSPLNTTIIIDLYDNTHTLLSHTQTNFTNPSGSWSNYDPGLSPVANVRYVQFRNIASTGGGATLDSFLDNCTVTYGGSTSSAAVATSGDYGGTWNTPAGVGTTPGIAGGFDVPRNSATNYAACNAKVRKATALGGAFSDFVAFTGANPVCVVIPYFRRGSNTTSQTSASNPDFLAALDQADSGGGTLYWVDGATGTKHDITPVAGMIFDNANCVTTFYGTKIYVFGKVSGVYKLYYSNNTGTTWHLVKTLTNPKFIRVRRDDALLSRPQVYLADNGPMWFSSYGYTGPAGTPFIRNMPGSIIAFDTLW